jgi:transposase-like protein
MWTGIRATRRCSGPGLHALRPGAGLRHRGVGCQLRPLRRRAAEPGPLPGGHFVRDACHAADGRFNPRFRVPTRNLLELIPFRRVLPAVRGGFTDATLRAAVPPGGPCPSRRARSRSRSLSSLAKEFGVIDMSIRNWLRQAGLDTGWRASMLSWITGTSAAGCRCRSTLQVPWSSPQSEASEARSSPRSRTTARASLGSPGGGGGSRASGIRGSRRCPRRGSWGSRGPRRGPACGARRRGTCRKDGPPAGARQPPTPSRARRATVAPDGPSRSATGAW